MGKATKMTRSSIHALLKNYHSFPSIPGLLILPFSASFLLSQALVTSSANVQTISSRIQSLFEAAGFPATSQFYSLLNLKISQTIFSFTLTFPFALTFLLLAKAFVLQTILKLPRRKLHLYCPILLTHVFNSFLILSANAAILSLLFLAFTAVEIFHLSSRISLLALSAAGAILYSIVLANTMVTCNLAIIVSAVDNCSGYTAVLKACVLIRGRVKTALTLSLPANLSMAALEALFQYRVMKTYHLSSNFNKPLVSETIVIAYLYSFLLILDVIVSCEFFKSCKLGCRKYRCDGRPELEPEKSALPVEVRLQVHTDYQNGHP